jgi:cytochrome bd-type quinol oxidase subunit 1
LWDRATRSWGHIFEINFVFDVVTGIPMEFEFGTDWARFSQLSGGVTGQIDNPIVVNDLLSFLIYGTMKAEVKGLDQIPHDQWPSALPLLSYACHIMAGIGTWFVLLMLVSALLLWRGRLYTALGQSPATRTLLCIDKKGRRVAIDQTGRDAHLISLVGLKFLSSDGAHHGLSNAV